MSEPRSFYIGVKALIKNEQGQTLLLKANVTNHRNVDKPYWDIPGGRIEEGDSVLQTLKREIKEETGITKIEISDLYTAVISNHQIPRGEKVYGLALMVYKVKIPENSPIKISDEHIDYEWVDKEEAGKRLAHKYPKEFIEKLADADD